MLPCKLKEQLQNEYKYRIELHAHTRPASSCSEISPEQMVEIYSGKGYDAIVITNHFYLGNMNGDTKEECLDNYISDYEKTVDAAKAYNLKVFLGAELRFPPNCNDYMLYGADRNVLSLCYDYLDKEVGVFRKEVSLPNSVFVQAHPFRDGMELCAPSLLDGIESFNMHPGHNARIGIAARYAKENNFAVQTIGSDFHHLNRGHEAVSALRTKIMPETSFDIARILRSGDYLFEIGESALLLP